MLKLLSPFLTFVTGNIYIYTHTHVDTRTLTWIARIHSHTYINTATTTLCKVPAQLYIYAKHSYIGLFCPNKKCSYFNPLWVLIHQVSSTLLWKWYRTSLHTLNNLTKHFDTNYFNDHAVVPIGVMLFLIIWSKYFVTKNATICPAYRTIMSCYLANSHTRTHTKLAPQALIDLKI